MLHHPDIQKKVQQEIHNAIGQERMPTMKDKPILPYTEACILEIQRMADVAPLGITHFTLEDDVMFRGLTIPKGTWAASNLTSVFKDHILWSDPYTFDLTRFIDDDGMIVDKESLIVFSMG